MKKEYGIVLAAFLLFSLLLTFAEPRVDVYNGQGWDGRHYYTVAEQIRAGEPLEANAPFLWRPAVPALVALSGLDTLKGFAVVNWLAALAFTLLFPLWLSYFVADWRIRAVLTVGAIVCGAGSLRLIAWYPATIDAQFLLLLLVGLLLIERMRLRFEWRYILPFAALCIAGVLVREAALVLPITALAAVYPVRRRYQWQTITLAVSLLAGVGLLALIVQSFPAPNDYGFLDSVHMWFYRKTIPDYLLAWFMVYGSLIALVAANLQTARAFFTQHHHLAVFSAVVLFFSWFGGSDTVRFLWWLMPVAFALIAVILSQRWNALRRAPVLVVALIVTWLVTTRVFMLPTPPTTTQPTYIFPLLTWWSDGYTDIELAQVGAFRLSFWLLIQQMVALVLLTWWIWRAQHNETKLGR